MLQPPRVFAMSNIANATVSDYGVFGSYGKEACSHLKQCPAAFCYAGVTLRHVLTLMTIPGSFRQLNLTALIVPGVVMGYAVVIFGLIGLVIEIVKSRKDLIYFFLIFYLLYFIIITVAAIGGGVGARFRIPMLPVLAILSARGWFLI